MNNLIVSLKVIAPLMIYMLMGVALKRSGKLPEKLNNDINKLLVTVFLPFLMFKNIYNADLSGINGSFGLYAGIATIISQFVSGISCLVYAILKNEYFRNFHAISCNVISITACFLM